MTTNLEEIYSRYRKADFTDPLNIYLQFPDLRNDFLEVEQKDRRQIPLEDTKSPSKILNRIKWMDQSEIFLLVVTHTRISELFNMVF